ncbi:MAG: InlB B-repeat-containing protein [Clostridia bacterium]|nr:InlB B-repeat-containing protein [Clostridia bacterium]
MRKILSITFVTLMLVVILVACNEKDNNVTVSFNSNGGTEIPAQEIIKNEKAVEPQAPTKDGYEFLGWYLGTEKWSFSTNTVTSDITLDAKYQVIEYKITYGLNGGENNKDNRETYTIEDNEIILKPPTKRGYVFNGWYYDSNYNSPVTSTIINAKETNGDVSLNAKWITYDFSREHFYSYDMSKYVILPNYKDYVVEVDMFEIQRTICNMLLRYSKEYTVQLGDDVYVDLRAREVTYLDETEMIGKLIEELSINDLLISTAEKGSYLEEIQKSIVGMKIGESKYVKIVMPQDFEKEEYRGKEVCFVVEIKTKEVNIGDVPLIGYSAYLIDENGNRVKENGEDVLLLEMPPIRLYIGSNLYNYEFEQNIVGMKVGETKSFVLKMPNDFDEKNLAGKTVEFVVNVDSLHIAQEFNDEFVKKYSGTECNTTTEYEAYLKRYMAENDYASYIEDNSVILQYPELEKQELLAKYQRADEDFLMMNGMRFEDYVEKSLNMTVDEYLENAMKQKMILYAYAQNEGIKPTPDQISQKENELLEEYTNIYISMGKDEDTAKKKAQEALDVEGGIFYVYEKLIQDLSSEKMKSQTTYK